MNVELRHLRSFLVVAEELNFTKAANRLHVAQQALSTQIQQLEQELGVALFVRTTRKVELTAGGRALLERVPAALRKVDSVLAEVKRQADGSGLLTLGLLATSLLAFTPKLLRAFAADRPNVKVTLRNIPFSDPTGGVRDRQCDAALVWLPFMMGDLRCASLFTDPRVAVLPVDHRLARLERVSAAELAQEPFVWVDDMDPVARDFWTLADLRGGQPPKVGAKITGFEDLFAAVRAGQAVASSPSSIAGALPWTDLTTRPVDGLAPAVVGMCWRPADENPFVEALVDCAKHTAQSLRDQ
ncbi:MAG: LysR family transcriptional regulator [Bryobacteraceae bacterium]|nr:LysR family transcriptional regulator [Bryobacteraceae bacterium]